MSKPKIDSLIDSIADRCICEACEQAVQRGLADYLHRYIETAIIDSQKGKAGQEGQGVALHQEETENAAKPGVAQEGQAGQLPTETPTESPTVQEYPHKEYFEKLYNRLAPYERRMATTLRKIWERQRRIIIANLRKLKKYSRLSENLLKAENRPHVKQDEDDIIDSILYPSRAFINELSEEAKRFFVYVMAKEGQQFLDELDIDYRFDVMDPNVQKWIKSYAPRFAKELEAVSIEKLKAELLVGIEAGEGVPKLAQRIRGIFDDWSRQRAIDVAQNQVMRASNQSFLQSMRQSQVVKKKIWITAMDERTCALCMMLDGKVMELEENYYNLGDEEAVTTAEGQSHIYHFDYEGISAPPAHNRCRCAISGEVEY